MSSSSPSPSPFHYPSVPIPIPNPYLSLSSSLSSVNSQVDTDTLPLPVPLPQSQTQSSFSLSQCSATFPSSPSPFPSPYPSLSSVSVSPTTAYDLLHYVPLSPFPPIDLSDSVINSLFFPSVSSSFGLIEICGESGTGKTQFCHQVAIGNLIKESAHSLSRVVIAYTECGDFPINRLFEILSTRFPLPPSSSSSSPTDSQSENHFSLLDKILLIKVSGVDSLMKFVTISLPKICGIFRVQCVIIDSVAAAFRMDTKDKENNKNNKNSHNYEHHSSYSSSLSFSPSQSQSLEGNSNKQRDGDNDEVNDHHNDNDNGQDDVDENAPAPSLSSSSVLQISRSSDYFTLSSHLKKLISQYKMNIFVTNQVSDAFHSANPNDFSLPPFSSFPSHLFHSLGKSSNRYVVSALGLSWSQCVNTRIMLTRGNSTLITENERTNQQIIMGNTEHSPSLSPSFPTYSVSREMRILFSDQFPLCGVKFRIDSDGLHGVSPLVPLDEIIWNSFQKKVLWSKKHQRDESEEGEEGEERGQWEFNGEGKRVKCSSSCSSSPSFSPNGSDDQQNPKEKLLWVYPENVNFPPPIVHPIY